MSRQYSGSRASAGAGEKQGVCLLSASSSSQGTWMGALLSCGDVIEPNIYGGGHAKEHTL